MSTTETENQNSNPTMSGDAPNLPSQPATANPPSGAESEASSLASSTGPLDPNPNANPPESLGDQPAGAKASDFAEIVSATSADRRKMGRDMAAEHRARIRAGEFPDFLTPGDLLACFAVAFDKLPAREQHAEMKFIRNHYRDQIDAIELFEARQREAREANEDAEDAAADAAASAAAGE